MAAIHVEMRIRASAQQVWQALAATGEAHKAFAGVLKDSRMESEDLRVATFANGMVVKERRTFPDSSIACRSSSTR